MNIDDVLAGAPKEIQPDYDLRPKIRARIEESRSAQLPIRRAQMLWSLRYPLSTAALLLICITATVSVWLARRTPTDVARVESISASPGIVQVRNVEATYVSETNDLLRLLKDRRSDMDARTAELLERNLSIIDRAIRESRAALSADPNSEMLRSLLIGNYERKLEVLRGAAVITGKT